MCASGGAKPVNRITEIVPPINEASFIGGTISVILFTGFAPPLAHIALDFGDYEIFALMLLAFATFVGLGGDDIPKTIFSICIGLVFSAVGLDIMSGELS